MTAVENANLINVFSNCDFVPKFQSLNKSWYINQKKKFRSIYSYWYQTSDYKKFIDIESFIKSKNLFLRRQVNWPLFKLDFRYEVVNRYQNWMRH